MKNLKMYLSAFAVLAIVGSALAFKSKAFNAGTVWCFSGTPASGESCSSQGGTQVNFEVLSGGDVSTPCAAFSGTTPFNGSVTNECNSTTGDSFQSTGN